MNQDKSVCEQQCQLVTSELDNLGFAINESKSVFTPTQNLEFFGVIIDTVQFKVFLTEEKVEKIKYFCCYVLDSQKLTIRELSSLIGLFVHAFNAIVPGPSITEL